MSNPYPQLPPNPDNIDLQTPWPLDPGIHPTSFLQVQAWPGFPTVATMLTVLTKADRATMKAFLDRDKAAKEIQDANDIPAILLQAKRLTDEGTIYSVVEAESLRRKAGSLDIEAFQTAQNELRAVDQESRVFAADWCARCGALLFVKCFVPEAKAVEDRIIRLGGEIGTTCIKDGFPKDNWTSHGDPLLANLFYGIWSLACYFSREFIKPEYYPGTAIGLFADVLKD
jgi:hypothetical protein